MTYPVIPLAAADGVSDDWAPIQDCLDNNLNVALLAKPYKITEELTLRDGHTVTMTGGTELKMHTANRSIFRAVEKDAITLNCNGGVLFGEGSWSALWTGMGGHDDRAIHFIGCTRAIVNQPRIKNCASAGIAIIGGSDFKINSPHIEGTNAYDTPLPFQSNMQAGIYVRDHATYGEATGLICVGADISGVAQGILRENTGGASAEIHAQFISSNIHDITGQHAAYDQSGGLVIAGLTARNIALSVLKIQAADANQDIQCIFAAGISGFNIGSHLFELGALGVAGIHNCRLSGVGHGVASGLSLNAISTAFIKHVKVEVIVRTVTGNAVIIQGENIEDVDIDVMADDVGDDGVLVTATNSERIRIRPIIRNPNTNETVGAGISGVRVSSASAEVDLLDPEITDANGNMQYGVFDQVDGGVINVKGSVSIDGSVDADVRAVGFIEEWPTKSELTFGNDAIIGPGRVISSHPMRMKCVTNSASNVTLWARELPENTGCRVIVELQGVLSDISQRKSVTLVGTFYRTTGVVSQQGSTTELASQASGAFGGAYNLTVDGSNTILLTVNSGGAATYRWTAVVTVVPAA